MAEQENCARASKRRAPPSTHPPAPPKKRVVLGELTNYPNLALSQSSNLSHDKPPPRFSKTKISKTGKDVDVSPVMNPHKCYYSSSIYKYLHALEMEANRRPLPNYVEKVQTDLSKNMREILVDWLVEVAEEYKLASDTLYLAVSYIDRFLSIHDINRNKLQLLGVSSMLIASKYEEISPPNAEEFSYITDNTYTPEEVIDMEKELLRSLNFELGNPTAKTFLRILLKAAEENFQHSTLQLEFLASYLLELCLLDYECVRFLPSVAAASALFLSRFTIEPKKHPWNQALQCQTGYKPCDLKECVLAIHEAQSIIKESPLQGIRQKYLQPKFTCVAALTSGKIPASYFELIDECK